MILYKKCGVRWGLERKTAKKFPVWLLSHPPFYSMEAGCFSVSKNTENKPDIRYMGEGSNLLVQKEKDRVGRGDKGSMNLYSKIPRSSEKAGWSKG